MADTNALSATPPAADAPTPGVSAQSSASAPPRHGAPRWLVVLAFAAIYIVWGSTYVAIRYTVEDIPPFLSGALRFLAAGGAVFVAAWWHGRLQARTGKAPPLRLRRQDWALAALTGVLMFTVGNGVLSFVERRMPSGIAALVVATVPLWVVLLDWLRPAGARPTVLVLLGLVVGFAGVAILSQASGEGWADGVVEPLYIALIVAGSGCWAGGTLLNRSGSATARPPLFVWSGMQMLAGGLGLSALAIGRGELGAFEPASVGLRAWLSLAYLAVMGSIVTFTAYAWLLRVSSPAKVSSYAFVNPVVAVLVGWWLAGEPLSWTTALASALIIGAVALITVTKANPQPGSAVAAEPHAALRPERA